MICHENILQLLIPNNIKGFVLASEIGPCLCHTKGSLALYRVPQCPSASNAT